MRRLAIVLVVCLFAVEAEIGPSIRFTQFNCSALTKTMTLCNSRTTTHQDGRTTIGAKLRFSQPLETLKIGINGTFHLPRERQIILKTFSVDYCRSFEPKHMGRNIQSMLLRRLKDSSVNLPSKCPIAANVTYEFKEFYLEPNSLFNLMQRSNFTFFVSLFANRQMQALTYFNGVIGTN